MRTTVNLDDELFRQAKESAARTGRTFTAVLEEALRQALNRAPPASRPLRVSLPVSDCAPGLCPGVDLDDTAALLELMEQDDASA